MARGVFPTPAFGDCSADPVCPVGAEVADVCTELREAQRRGSFGRYDGCGGCHPTRPGSGLATVDHCDVVCWHCAAGVVCAPAGNGYETQHRTVGTSGAI